MAEEKRWPYGKYKGVLVEDLPSDYTVGGGGR